MKRNIIAFLCACVIGLNFVTVAAATEKNVSPEEGTVFLLSGNAVGSLFGEDIPRPDTKAEYTWQKYGNSAAPDDLLSADSEQALINGNGRDMLCCTSGQAAVVFDMKDTYEISKIDVWTECNSGNCMGCFEVYASINGEDYQFIATKENANQKSGAVELLSLQDMPVFFARYIKLIFQKDESAGQFRVSETAIYGKQAPQTALLSRNADYSYVTELPFATGEDMIDCDTEQALLHDGDTNVTADTEGEYANILFDLGEHYQIDTAEVWSKIEANSFMDGFELKFSSDGFKYFSVGYFANSNDKQSARICKTVGYGVPGRNARYVKVIPHSNAQKMSISEIAIYGRPLYDGSVKTTETERVILSYYRKNYDTVYLDWSAYNAEGNNVNKYALYVETSDFSNVNGRTPKKIFEADSREALGKASIYFDLKPETTYYAAVTPFTVDGEERKDVTTTKLQPLGVLGGGKVGDIFSINQPPAGGGNYNKHGTEEENVKAEVLRLLSEIDGINNNRWWEHGKATMDSYGKYGMNFHTYWHGTQNLPVDNGSGVYSFSTRNEPDLKGTDVNEYYRSIEKAYKEMKQVDSRNILIEPALGGTEPACMTWLENMYNADGQNGALTKTYFDAMDIHLYCKIIDGKLPGLVEGAPEMLLGKIDEVRELMARHGDADKPLLSTELGWSTYTGKSYLRIVDRETQRKYLLRGYMHCIAKDLKAVYWYSGIDDGVDETNLEHNLGVIDWFGVPKPAYYGWYILSNVLKDAQYVRAVPYISHPYYGYEFWDEGKNRCITSVWAANEEVKTMTFSTLDKNETELLMVGGDGTNQTIPVENGTGRVTISGMPGFIYSKGGIKIHSADDTFTLRDNTFAVKRGDTVTLCVDRTSNGAGIAGDLRLKLPEGWSVLSGTTVEKNASNIEVKLQVPLNTEEKIYDIKLQVVSGGNIEASMMASVEVVQSLEIKITPYTAQKTAPEEWFVNIALENLTDEAMEVKIAKIETENFAVDQSKAFETIVLPPKESEQIQIPITKMPENNTVRLKVSIDAGGYVKKIQRMFNFTASINDGKTPAVDGVISDGEWTSAIPIKVNRQDQAARIANWDGEDDLSFTVYNKWDEKNLYLAVDAKDNKHNPVSSGAEMWQGDSVQFALDVSRENGTGGTVYHEIGISLSDNGFSAWRWTAPEKAQEGKLTSAKGEAVRTDGHTVYEIAIPWSDLMPNRSAPSAGDILGFSILLNDNDGSGRRGWAEYAGGIGSSKNTNQFADLIFIK
ncbi:MAG: hypothetical protein J6N52_07315 [Clostridia bacterium]|nr:hypothetical protein [Clostridia bacterium]